MSVLTKIMTIENKENFLNTDIEKIKECASAIQEGKTVVFPTDTVYGIGALGLREEAVEKIFIAKKRPKDNPLLLLISHPQMLDELVSEVGEIERKLVKHFWPGPLTIIFHKKEGMIPDIVTAKLDTIGIRIPNDNVALKLLEEVNAPLAAPSANLSGNPSGTCMESIVEDLNEKVDYILDGGKTPIGIESTIVQVKENKVRILRLGKVTKEEIESLGITVEDVDNLSSEKSISEKFKHYSLKVPSILIWEGNEEKTINKIKDLINQNIDKKIMVVGQNKHQKISKEFSCVEYISLGNYQNLEEVSTNLFSILRVVNDKNPALCLIEGMEEKSLGAALMNRLKFACKRE